MSAYPREKVPIIFFLENPDDPDTKIFANCEECRKKRSNYRKELINKKYESLKDDEFLCERCVKTYKISDRSKNLDGSEGKLCIKCKENKKEYSMKKYENKKEDQQYIILKRIQKNGASCENCKCIFLKPVADTKYAVTLETYDYNGIRCVDYEDRIYRSSDFIKRFEKHLEMRILEMDHLTEEEQRERGILQPDEPFEPKLDCIANLEGKALINEFKKIQVLCCKCHIIVTESRRRRKRSKTKLTQEKIAYTNELKKSGCSVCGFYDENILRFLEFDHLNTKEKLYNISDMKMYDDFSLEDMKDELKKTRIICKHCHKIHTSEQFKRGEISTEKHYDSSF